MHNIRLASTLSFDENSEADIINMIDYLNSKHRMGDFISSLFRIAVDNPELLVKGCSNEGYTEGIVVKAVENLGKTKVRAEYIRETKEEVKKLENKIDEIYQICLEVKTAFEFGKRNGLEQSTDNILSTTFVIENQLKKLRKIVSTNNSISSAMAVDIAEEQAKFEDKASNVMEYIIKSYEPIITEVIRAANSVRENTVQEVKVKVEQPPVQQILQPVYQPMVQPVAQPVVQNMSQGTIQNFVDTTKVENKIENSNTSTNSKNNNSVDIKPTDFIIEEEEEENIDFSNADLDLLANFFSN